MLFNKNINKTNRIIKEDYKKQFDYRASWAPGASARATPPLPSPHSMGICVRGVVAVVVLVVAAAAVVVLVSLLLLFLLFLFFSVSADWPWVGGMPEGF